MGFIICNLVLKIAALMALKSFTAAWVKRKIISDLAFRLLPFTQDTLKAIGLALSAYLVARLIPVSGYDLYDLVLRSGFFALIFAVLVLRFRVSEDLNGLEQMILGRFRK